MDYDNIIKKLPYSEPFLFVDKLVFMDENRVEGSFIFKREMDFFRGHFKDNPIVPGVILTECCAQIGLACLGLFLIDESDTSSLKIALSGSEMEFYLPVFPDEMVKVISEKIYFRFQKLKCKVKMYNAENKLVCKGVLAGMIKPNTDDK